MATIGKKVAQGARARRSRFVAIINPQSGVGGATPKPKKERALKDKSIHDQCKAPQRAKYQGHLVTTLAK